MPNTIDFSEFTITNTGRVRAGDTRTLNAELPNTCPRCGCVISPIMLSGYCMSIENGGSYVATLYCQNCRKPFIAHYSSNQTQPLSVAPASIVSREFDLRLCTLSPGFVETYNQALASESLSLNQISGMAYRKSIEYLIKDYLIKRSPAAADSIRAEALGAAINNRISNERLKTAASRAIWLGNDFTHYTRKYTEYEISSMKDFIEATLHWILMELITDEAESMDRR